MRHTDSQIRRGPVGTRAEPRSRLEVFDRRFRLPGPQPKPTAICPTASETRVEHQGPVNQFDGGIDVFAKISQYEGGGGQDKRVVRGGPKRPPGEINPIAAA